MADSLKKEQVEDYRTVLNDFLNRNHDHVDSLLRDDAHLQAILPHMHEMTQAEKEDINRKGNTAIRRGGDMLDFVRREERETFDLQKQFLQQLCKLDPLFQKKIRSDPKIKDYLDIFVGPFQYSRTSEVTMFPVDSKAYQLLKDEFNSSVGNPFLPSFKEFCSRCSVKAEVSHSKKLTVDDVRKVLEEWAPKKGRNATVEDIVHLAESLGLLALREKLVAEECFGVHIQEAKDCSKSEEDDFSFKLWDPDPTRAMFKMSRGIVQQSDCIAVGMALGVPRVAMAIVEAVPPYAFQPTHAYDMMKAWRQANGESATAKKLRDALIDANRRDIVDEFKA